MDLMKTMAPPLNTPTRKRQGDNQTKEIKHAKVDIHEKRKSRSATTPETGQVRGSRGHDRTRSQTRGKNKRDRGMVRPDNREIKIPVVDFDVYGLGGDEVPDEQLSNIVKEMNEAFTEIGFVYLKNTGIDQEQVNEVMEISKEFFLLPEDIKKKFSISTQPNFPYFGWVSVETERLNPDRPGDLKEVYGVTTLHPDIVWPPEDTVAGFQKTMESFFNRCEQLSLRILRVMALILGLEGNFFLDKHNEMSGNKNGTTLSTLYYPSVDMSSVKEGQIRCGEHSDYGSITLLFQSDKSGLEVMNQAGEYISAPPIPGAVLINIADLMQRWTCDRFVSAKHRVILTPPGDKSTRQSLAFFVHPDDNAMISSFDGSDKYAPINALDYLNERLSDTFSM